MGLWILHGREEKCELCFGCWGRLQAQPGHWPNFAAGSHLPNLPRAPPIREEYRNTGAMDAHAHYARNGIRGH